MTLSNEVSKKMMFLQLYKREVFIIHIFNYEKKIL